MSRKAKTTKTKTPVAKDKFGCRLNTECALIDAQLTKRPKTVDAICEATKLSRVRVRGHLRFLAKKKLVKETDKGFVATLTK